MPQKIPIAIIGATGYTGIELARILVNHPRVEIVALTSRQNTGTSYSSLFPAFAGRLDKPCIPLQISPLSRKIKAAFLCLPHHESMNVAKAFRSRGVRVIDLSADFRLKNFSLYEEWYGKHSQKKLLQDAVYGLPELYRQKIKEAKLVASPGCYPTSILLGLTPLLQKKMISTEGIICDSKSGVSGAGRASQMDILFGEVNDSLKAYKVGTHRHTAEIEQELSLQAGEPLKVLFSPHLVPMDRGILSTIYATPLRKWSTADLVALYQKFYRKEKFVTVLPEGILPVTKNVRGTNQCHVAILYDKRTDRIVIISAIDNLTKGASGQAVQSFNLMFGLDETLGLKSIGMIP